MCIFIRECLDEKKIKIKIKKDQTDGGISFSFPRGLMVIPRRSPGTMLWPEMINYCFLFYGTFDGTF